MPIEKRVFKNLQLFVENKKEGDDLFDRLNTSILNEYLSSLMPGLTAKVFRTYNASITLQEQLNKLTDADDNIPAKVNYNANLTVHGEEGWGDNILPGFEQRFLGLSWFQAFLGSLPPPSLKSLC